MKRHHPIVLVDFDGVIHKLGKWDGPKAKGDEIEGAREALKMLRERGCWVTVFSARNTKRVYEWLEGHEMLQFVHEVTNIKIPGHTVIFDDSAITIARNKPHALEHAVQKWLSRRRRRN